MIEYPETRLHYVLRFNMAGYTFTLVLWPVVVVVGAYSNKDATATKTARQREVRLLLYIIIFYYRCDSPTQLFCIGDSTQEHFCVQVL